eukprot:TRINITY_DN952_c0_g1_i3.p1 TRINITY_DN952_c0_g1~~TRINITY_DN952_c0_g1_i3.p1  ORF type:complete len:233 (+),score=42.25 TRINITY_DN952_c0_g1_i3:98-796(+)
MFGTYLLFSNQDSEVYIEPPVITTGQCEPVSGLPEICRDFRTELPTSSMGRHNMTFSGYYYKSMDFDNSFNEELFEAIESFFDKVDVLLDSVGYTASGACKNIFMRYACDYYYPVCDINCTPLPICSTLCLDFYTHCIPVIDVFDSADFKPFLPGGSMSHMFDLTLEPEKSRITQSVLDNKLTRLELDSTCLDPHDSVVTYTKSCNTYNYRPTDDKVCYSQEECENCRCPVG